MQSKSGKSRSWKTWQPREQSTSNANLIFVNMHSHSEISNFYDSFAEYELKSGVNLRHYTLFNAIIKSGLRRNHHVLEIGCGIGQLTGLLSRYLRKGKLVSTDISPRSIGIASKRVPPSSRMEFLVSDMTLFGYPEKFDYIVLPDVLEHIPVENHFELFANLSKLMYDHSKIIIHIPHPKIIEYERIHHPQKLQIIDQPISADTLLQSCYAHQLILETYHSYSLFHVQPDYVFIVLKRDELPQYIKLTRFKIITRKSIARLIKLIFTI